MKSSTGGSWFRNGFDGSKYVCLDDFQDLDHGGEPCLVYSFGIGADVSFEEAMLQYGEYTNV